MRAIIAFFSAVDAAIQRRFDSLCFFLMRRFGVRKSSIRYALFALAIIGLCGVSIHLARVGYVMQAVVVGIFLPSMLTHQYISQVLDREAESRPDGAPSQADYAPTWHDKAVAAVSCLTALYLATAYPTHALALTGVSVFMLAGLLLLYLAKTPMNPPAEKERESIFTSQPAPAKL